MKFHKNKLIISTNKNSNTIKTLFFLEILNLHDNKVGSSDIRKTFYDTTEISEHLRKRNI